LSYQYVSIDIIAEEAISIKISVSKSQEGILRMLLSVFLTRTFAAERNCGSP